MNGVLDVCRTETTVREIVIAGFHCTVVSKSSTVTFRDGFARISVDGRPNPGPNHRNKAPLFAIVSANVLF